MHRLGDVLFLGRCFFQKQIPSSGIVEKQFSTNTSAQRMQAAHEVLIPSSFPAEACMYLPGSRVLRGKQCCLLGKKSNRVLDEPV